MFVPRARPTLNVLRRVAEIVAQRVPEFDDALGKTVQPAVCRRSPQLDQFEEHDFLVSPERDGPTYPDGLKRDHDGSCRVEVADLLQEFLP